MTTAIGAAALSVTACGSSHTAPPPKTYLLNATLSARQETPPVNGAERASGVFKGTLTVSGKTGKFTWQLSSKMLSGRALGAAIRNAARGKNGPVAISLCRPCTADAHGAYSGPAVASSAFLTPLLRGDAYVNVETKKNPAGEIRGRINVAKPS
jgi:hypothetical protein